VDSRRGGGDGELALRAAVVADIALDSHELGTGSRDAQSSRRRPGGSGMDEGGGERRGVSERRRDGDEEEGGSKAIAIA